MHIESLRGRSRYLRGLALALVVLSSAIMLLPDLSRNGGAAPPPAFSRPNVRIDKTANAVEASTPGGPSMAVDAMGILHAVWSDARTAADQGIYYSRSPDGGASWTVESRIDGSLGLINVAPSIVVDETGGPYDGDIYVVWQRDQAMSLTVQFTESTDGGDTWAGPRTIDAGPSGSPGMYPRVAVDSVGKVHVAYMVGTVGSYLIADSVSIDGGVMWTKNTVVQPDSGFQGYPSIATGGGVVCVAWEESTALSDILWFAASTDNGATWNRNWIISFGSGPYDASWVSITVDDGGEFHAAWVAADNTGVNSVAYSHSKDGGATWAAPAKVSDAPASTTYVAHSVTILASSDSLYAVWSDNRRGDFDIFASWSKDDGLTWGDGMADNDVRVDDTDDNGSGVDDATVQSAPFAAIDANGVYVIWSDNRDFVTSNAYFAGFDLADVMITEFMDGPDGMEQVEIYNAVRGYVDMTGWTMEIDGLPISLSVLGLVGPNTYRTVGDPVASNVQRDITLGDEGGVIRLLDSVGMEIDRVAYGQLGPVPDPIEGESVARVPIGISYRPFWARTQLPTFGSVNIASAPNPDASLVLNEVFFDAANPDDRFIEVYLNGDRAMDIGGFVVAGDAAYTLPSTLLTDFDREFGIRASDAPALFSLMGASGDNLYLYDPTGSFVDMVGWSSAHPQGTSMARVPAGSGDSSGYDDASSIAAGWLFERSPSLPLVSVGPDQTSSANPGDRIYFLLTARNKQAAADYVNVQAFTAGEGWQVSLLEADGITPLSDSPGDPDSAPDLGLLASGESSAFYAAITVPSTDPGNESVKSYVMVSAASNQMARSTATLLTILYPYESPRATVDPSAIWVDTSPPGCQPKEARLTLTVSGMGTPIYGGNVQDTVMVMDSSGSMTTSDPTGLRLAAAKRYVDLMKVPDRAAVVSFADTATLVDGDHLSSDYVDIKVNIDKITSSGSTDIYDAIRIATDELLTYGNDDHLLIQILLTDGEDTTGHTDDVILAEAQRAAANNIKIFTIGLGDIADEVLLKGIADATDAMYLKAETAEDLDQIYQLIGNVTKAIAGYDDNVLDDIPMINILLPTYVHYIPGSASPAPSYAGVDMGMTNIQWNVSKLRVGQTWTATFTVTSNHEGYRQRALYYPLSRVTYFRHDDVRVNMPFPVTLIDVLAAPLLPDLSVSSAEIIPSPQPPFVEGDVVSIAATIHNIGQSSSGQTVVTFHDGLPPAPQIGADQPLYAMDPGLSQDVFIQWTALGPGTHAICVFADPGDLIMEETEANNVACVDVAVSPLPPSMPDYIPYFPEPAYPRKVALSADVRLSLIVANVGNASATAGSALSFGNLTGAPFALLAIPPLPQSGTSPRYFATWKAPPFPGIYNVIARADCLGEIAEWDESNNAYTWTIEVVPAPVTSLAPGEPRHEATRVFVTSSTPIDFSVVDLGGTGIEYTEYRIDGGGWVNYTAQGRFFLHGEGEHSIEWHSFDHAGNAEPVSSAVIAVDDTPPETTLAIGDPKFISGASFVTSQTPLSLEAEDGGAVPVGLDVTSFRVWNGAWSQWSPFASPFTLEGPDGVKLIEFRSTDLLGNRETSVSATVIVDDTAPVMTLDPPGSLAVAGATFSLTADDGGGSGVNYLWLSVDGESPSQYGGPFTLQLGTHRIVYMSADNLGNSAQNERVVQLVAEDSNPVVVRFNYKPMIAFLFSLLLIGAAALSARERKLRRCKVPWKRFLASWAMLSLPFVLIEVVTGFISIYFEPMRIPPLIGMGMAVDSIVLGAGLSFLLGRLAFRRKSGEDQIYDADASESSDSAH